MNLIRNFRNLWKIKTGKDDSPLDGETPFWIFSLIFHIILLFALSGFFVEYRKNRPVSVEVSDAAADIEEIPEFELDLDVDDEVEELGAAEDEEFQAMMDLAPLSDAFDEPDSALEESIRDIGEFELEQFMPEFDAEVDVTTVAVNGVAGFATNNTDGAIDRITHEIILSLEENKTLVVWMFDQSASLLKQRSEIVRRFENVYDELDEIHATGDEAFEKHDDIPLLTQVVAFGQRSNEMLRKPTDNIDEIKKAISNITVDETGVENVFGSVASVARKYKSLCKVDRKTGQRKRNVLIVIISDESGDDIQNLDPAIDLCRRNLIRVYTIGVPAPFGREHTYVKWVDPDPKFDQSPQWAPVRQGPESVQPERIKLHFTENEEEEELFDSGFGPFGLTRLCYQTGGVYFTVHPNRQEAGGEVPRWETSTYSAHLTHFFDPDVMRRYRPDYVSPKQYQRQLGENQSRLALVGAARASRVTPLQPPRLRFPRLDEAAFVQQVSLAQRSSAFIEPEIEKLYQILKTGEKDREREFSLRWKAGYDLAMGRTLAVKIRAATYNSMLAQVKTSLRFEQEKNNTWVLRPANKISTGSKDEKLAEKARMYLQRVVDEHPGTPWAFLADRELKRPIGWEWRETFTQPPQPRQQRPRNNNNNNNRPRPMRQPTQPPPKRPPPKL